MVAHPEHDLLPVERFGQEVGGAECRGVALCDAAFLFDQDDDRRETGAVSVAPEPSQYLHAVGRRHAEVKEDQVGGEVPECLLRLARFGHRADFVRDVHEHGFQQSNVHLFVVDDENPVAREWSLGSTIAVVQLDSEMAR